MNIAIFASGNGSNCENIIKYFKGHDSIVTALVVCNNATAKVLERAESLSVPTAVITKAELNNNPEMVMALLDKYNIGFIVLAGFLPLVPKYLIEHFNHRMINLHPALLPKYGGKGMYGHHVHEAVKAAGEKETGMTIHWVSEVCDGGEIIQQYRTPLSPDDTVDDIASKEHELEMRYFPQCIEKIIMA